MSGATSKARRNSGMWKEGKRFAKLAKEMVWRTNEVTQDRTKRGQTSKLLDHQVQENQRKHRRKRWCEWASPLPTQNQSKWRGFPKTSIQRVRELHQDGNHGSQKNTNSDSLRWMTPNHLKLKGILPLGNGRRPRTRGISGWSVGRPGLSLFLMRSLLLKLIVVLYGFSSPMRHRIVQEAAEDTRSCDP